MTRKQTTARQRQHLERILSQLAPWIQDLAPQAQVDFTLEQYEDEDAHVYVHPPQGMTAEDVEGLELTVGERCNEILLDTGLFIVSAVSGGWGGGGTANKSQGRAGCRSDTEKEAVRIF